MTSTEQFNHQFGKALAWIVAGNGNNAQITVGFDEAGDMVFTPVVDNDFDRKTAGVIWDSRYDEALPMLRTLAVKTSPQAACDAYVGVQSLHILWEAQVLAHHIKAPELRTAVLGCIANLLAKIDSQSAYKNIPFQFCEATGATPLFKGL